MSLTKHQTPNIVHQCIYPEYYTCKSDNYTNDKFQYKYELYTADGLLSSYISYPAVDGGLSFTNVNVYLQNTMGVDFNPEIYTFTPCPNSIKQYELKVIEVNGDDDETTFTKSIALNNSTEDFLYTDYMLVDDTSNLLTPITFTRKVDLTKSLGSFRFLSGIFNPIGVFIISRVKEILLKVYRGKYIYTYVSVVKNPYYDETTLQPPAQILSDKSKYLLDFPATPKQLNNMLWNCISVQYGTQHFVPPSGNLSDIIEEGDTYTLQTTKLKNQTTSKALTFEVDSCAQDQIELIWENELGGYDFFNFNI